MTLCVSSCDSCDLPSGCVCVLTLGLTPSTVAHVVGGEGILKSCHLTSTLECTLPPTHTQVLKRKKIPLLCHQVSQSPSHLTEGFFTFPHQELVHGHALPPELSVSALSR